MFMKDLILLIFFILDYYNWFTKAGDVESARCRVRCLALLKHRLGNVSAGKEQYSITLERCLEDQFCIACLQPCGQPYISTSHCQQLCQDSDENCEQSCMFLRHMRSYKPGDCPHPQDMTGKATSCIVQCDKDYDCAEDEKCCHNGCGEVCQKSIGRFIGVPNIPKITHLREKIKTGSVEVSWTAVTTNNSVPILYIVQNQWKEGAHATGIEDEEWQQLTPTTDTTSILRNIAPDRWYRFRIAAVSVNGSKGFSPPTDAFRLSKEPLPPSAPTNLTEDETIITDGKLSIKIKFMPPRRSDLEVARYKVYWVKRMPGDSSHVSMRENKKVLDGNELSYTIHDLNPDTTYFVQVQAISVYGDIRLKSERASLFVTTHAFDNIVRNGIDDHDLIDVESLITLPAVENITIHQSYFHDGRLKANISWNVPRDIPEKHKVILKWSPEVCIADPANGETVTNPITSSTHNHYFSIYDLRFDCRYLVKLQVKAKNGELGKITEIAFSSASCSEVEIIGKTRPDCPFDPPRIPDVPSGLQHSFLIVNVSITARISWEAPPFGSPVTGYRIVWGRTIQFQKELQPILDEKNALTEVLSKDVTVFKIPNLKEAVSYMVQLQALSVHAAGKIAKIFLTTPVLRTSPLSPPYRVDKLELRQSDNVKFVEKEHSSLYSESSSKIPQPSNPKHSHSSSYNTKTVNLHFLISICILILLYHHS